MDEIVKTYLKLSTVIENAPYVLTEDYKSVLSGKSKGNSSGSCRSNSHSSKSSSSSKSGGSINLETIL